MPTLSQSSAHYRSPRARLASATPAVLRFPNGGHSRGELKVISVTGGLLSLPRPLDRGSRVKLMFLTQTGAVRGAAEMLNPVSWALQPFRFMSIDEGDQCRLRAAIQLSLGQNGMGDEWIEKYRANLIHRNPPRKRFSRMILAALTLAAASLGSAIIYGVCLK
jgi:hypothetical protein